MAEVSGGNKTVGDNTLLSDLINWIDRKFTELEVTRRGRG